MNSSRPYTLQDMQAYEIPDRFHLGAGDEVGDYTIQNVLGEGSFGIVYKVTHHTKSTTYAMKVLKLYAINTEQERRHLLKRFAREFECGQIDGKHLVRSHSFGKYKGNPYIIMDYCPNGTLVENARLMRPKIDWNVINTWARGILLGLEELHTNGRFHRDIKPENVLFDGNGRVKLTDFGITGYKNNRMTARNVLGAARDIFGTFAYIAPEQANNRTSYGALNAVTDIFSFGATMYEVLTGHLPFGPLRDNAELIGYLEKAKKGEHVPLTTHLSSVQKNWEYIISRSLHPDYKKERFQSARAILELLGQPAPKPEVPPKAPSTGGLITLIVMDGEEPGRRYVLPKMLNKPQGILKVGWFNQDQPRRNNIEIQETLTNFISNFHATIERSSQPDRWYIRNGQWRKKQGKMGWYLSTNGVYINSQELPVAGRQLLINDVLMIGDTTLKVTYT